MFSRDRALARRVCQCCGNGIPKGDECIYHSFQGSYGLVKKNYCVDCIRNLVTELEDLENEIRTQKEKDKKEVA